MRAVLYLTGYIVSMSLDYTPGAWACFLLLFTSLFMKHLARVRTPWVRVPLVSLVYPFRTLDYLFVVVRYAPMDLFTKKPWLLSWSIYIATIEGLFVPKETP